MSIRQRRDCVFNKSLQKKFPYIRKQRNKTNSDVFCEVCSSNFCIANGGLTNIRRHITTAKHQKSVRESAKFRKHTDKSESTPTDEKNAEGKMRLLLHLLPLDSLTLTVIFV